MEDGFAHALRDASVGILGLGLMGGSLAMSLNGKCARLIGCDARQSALELALSKGIIHHAENDSAKLPAQVDILILATPVPSIIEFLQQLPLLTSKTLIVMDIGSTKRDILQAMSVLPDNFDPIGGHPICGKEKLGLENADANLYQSAPFVITSLERTTQRAKSAAEQIIFASGANCFEMTAEEHDRILAATSHLPFLISSALVHSTPQEYASFVGPGFRSTSRLADTPSHMMMGILKSNRDNVLSAIRLFQNTLDEIESALHDENYAKLEVMLNKAQNQYQTFTQ